MSECRLQINERGSWRNVMDFEAKAAPTAKGGAELLQRAGGTHSVTSKWRLTFRIIENNEPRLCLDESGKWKSWGN